MESIKIDVTGSVARVVGKPRVITSGTVGLKVEFSYDEEWERLHKTAVFQACEEKRTLEDVGFEATVPWEVLVNPDVWLQIGLCGLNSEGTVVIPTIWANVSIIKQGTNFDGDPGMDPQLPFWKRLSAEIEELRAEISDVKEMGQDGLEDLEKQLEKLIKDLDTELAAMGMVKTVNGIEPDENGNVEVEVGGSGLPEGGQPGQILTVMDDGTAGWMTLPVYKGEVL